jgi:hypothetical protein
MVLLFLFILCQCLNGEELESWKKPVAEHSSPETTFRLHMNIKLVIVVAITCVHLAHAAYSVYEMHGDSDGSCAVGTLSGVVVYFDFPPATPTPCTSMGWLNNYARQYSVESFGDIITTGMDWVYSTHDTNCDSKVVRLTYGRFGCLLYNMGSGEYFVNTTHLIFRAQSFPPPSQYNHTACPNPLLSREFPLALRGCTGSRNETTVQILASGTTAAVVNVFILAASVTISWFLF